MLVSVLVVFFLGLVLPGAAVKPSNYVGALADQATLTSFVVMTLMMVAAMITISPLMDDSNDSEDSSSDSEGDGTEKKNNVQLGQDVEWELVKTARSGKDGLLTTHGCFTYHKVICIFSCEPNKIF